MKQIVCSMILLITGWGINAQQKEIARIGLQAGVPAIQLVHIKKGRLHSYCYGVKNSQAPSSITTTTKFQAASLTKVITAYAFFRLMDKGMILLDTPLFHYYPYDRLKSEPAGAAITARMILTHRSGLLNWEGAVGTAEWETAPLHLQFQPGSRYSYSGEGFYFLQLVMEKISGKPFSKIIEEEVLQPLHMKQSAIEWDDRFEAHTALGHYSLNAPRKPGRYRHANAAYTLYTTATDYAQFVQQALNKGIGLKKETYRLMIRKAAEITPNSHPRKEDALVPCVLGLRMQLNEKGTALWHTGSNPGFRCFFITYPASEESLIVFMNSDTGFTAMKPLMRLFLGTGLTYPAYDWRKGELD